MSDIPCIQQLSMISEDLKDDLLKGKAMDILLLLLSGSKTVKEIGKELDLPSFSIQLYIKRLIEANLIKVIDVKVVDGKVEKTYELASTDVEILNYLEKNSTTTSETSIELSAQHFATMTRNVVRNIDSYKHKPHKLKAYFIKADEEAVKAFKSELDALFEKYQAIEDLDAAETYGFISVLAPYRLT